MNAMKNTEGTKIYKANFVLKRGNIYHAICNIDGYDKAFEVPTSEWIGADCINEKYRVAPLAQGEWKRI